MNSRGRKASGALTNSSILTMKLHKRNSVANQRKMTGFPVLCMLNFTSNSLYLGARREPAEEDPGRRRAAALPAGVTEGV